jgi:hypothetical protein
MDRTASEHTFKISSCKETTLNSVKILHSKKYSEQFSCMSVKFLCLKRICLQFKRVLVYLADT